MSWEFLLRRGFLHSPNQYKKACISLLNERPLLGFQISYGDIKYTGLLTEGSCEVLQEDVLSQPPSPKCERQGPYTLKRKAKGHTWVIVLQMRRYTNFSSTFGFLHLIFLRGRRKVNQVYVNIFSTIPTSNHEHRPTSKPLSSILI